LRRLREGRQLFLTIVYPVGVEERRPLCRQPDDRHFGSLLKLAVTGSARTVSHARLQAVLLG
jgi:hypothetical protein